MNKAEILTEIIAERRAVFPPMYTGEVVEDEVIEQLLENANWAPNHRKTEPWRFIVMRQKDLPRLCAYGAKWYKDFTPEEAFSEMKYKKIQTKALSASHVIAICMKRDPEKSVPKWEEKAAVACAVQNMWLTVTAMGLGSYWSTPGYAIHSDEFFGLEKGESCMGLFYVGVVQPNVKLEGTRGDITEKVRWFE